MKKLLQYTTITVLGLFLITSCKKGDATPTALASVGTNTTSGSVDQGTLSRQIYVSGLTGDISEVKVRFTGSVSFIGDMEIFLKSPSGKIIELCNDQPDAANNAFDVYFSDAATTSVDVWTSVAGNSIFSGTFKPKGSLSTSTDGYTGTITSFDGYKGGSPNGTWTLYISDDAQYDLTNFISWELFLSTVN